MVFTAIALRANAIAAKPLVLLQVLVPVTLFYVALLVIGIAVGRVSLPRADAVALLYGTSLRNLSISLAIAVNAFGKAGADAALVLAAAFIVQTQVATWSTKFVDRLFGKPLEATS
jgi:ACR3 family arsenite efflux pump ArsB